jgi:hypothetical protein
MCSSAAIAQQCIYKLIASSDAFQRCDRLIMRLYFAIFTVLDAVNF